MKLISAKLCYLHLILFTFLFSASSSSAQQVASIKSNFNYLYMSVKTFKTLDKDKYVFQHYLDQTGTLILRGWNADGLWGRKFDTVPTVSLAYWKASKVSILNNYLGDLIIGKHDFKRIRKNISATTRYVVFEPYMAGSILKYKILITEDELIPKDQQAFRDPVLIDIKLSANPSPPKNFY